MATTGRPRALDEIKRREVCALASAGFSLASAGQYVGCSAKTIRREAERDPEFGDQLRKCQLGAKLEPLRALQGKAQTHWRAAAWLLERVDPEQFAKYDSKLLTPEEVGDLLDNIIDTLEAAVTGDYNKLMVSRIIEIVRNEVNLPSGRRNVYARLNTMPLPGIPSVLDHLKEIFAKYPGGDKPTEADREADELELAGEQSSAGLLTVPPNSI